MKWNLGDFAEAKGKGKDSLVSFSFSSVEVKEE
jgi:hypothetical protein